MKSSLPTNSTRISFWKYKFPVYFGVIFLSVSFGLFGWSSYEHHVRRSAAEEVARKRDEARLAMFIEYEESGKLIGMSDEELVALLGSNKPYLRLNDIDYRSWTILSYVRPEDGTTWINYGRSKYFVVESTDGRVLSCRIEDRYNG